MKLVWTVFSIFLTISFVMTHRVASAEQAMQAGQLVRIDTSVPEEPIEQSIELFHFAQTNQEFFFTYNGHNAHSLSQIFEILLNDNRTYSNARISLLVPKIYFPGVFNSDKELSDIFYSNRDRIDLIFSPNVKIHQNFWMRDGHLFAKINGEKAVLAFDYYSQEENVKIEDSTAYVVAKSKQLPLYKIVHPDDTSLYQNDGNALSSGGNFLLLPGNILLVGKILSDFPAGFWSKDIDNNNRSLNDFLHLLSIQSNAQDDFRYEILPLDVAPFHHIDELFSVIKTNGTAPCDYAILVSSPRKAIEIINKTISLIAPSLLKNQRRCTGYSYKLLAEISDNTLRSNLLQEMDNHFCVGHIPLEFFAKEPILSDITAINYSKILNNNSEYAHTYQDVINENLEKLLPVLRERTHCDHPLVIDLPVLFAMPFGSAIFPNAVNGIVLSATDNAVSTYIYPRSYFSPFDVYIVNILKKYGIDARGVYDLPYHVNKGEVHCASNSLPI
ncbi:MAG: hypothetical protein HQK53_07975 [Oligoflexia bacterium]|nr:hypothetical protein [Oligoflexia bacterium]